MRIAGTSDALASTITCALGAVKRSISAPAWFFTVSVAALGINLVVLELLVRGGMGDIPAQALAVAIAMPFNFIGNKLWTFA